MMEEKINIIGAGLAGLSAAIHISKAGRKCRLISLQPSERAQSIMAEGGINAALNTMGEEDKPYEHFIDTRKGGCFLADENAIWNLANEAPDIVRWLWSIGVPFNMNENKMIQRNFGGQKKKRTAYAKSSTGKMIMTALIDEARKYENEGYIERLCSHKFVDLIIQDGKCAGVRIQKKYTDELMNMYGNVIIACGGMNGLFSGATTGSTANTGDIQAVLFSQGVHMANLEFIQYHPTTAPIQDKRFLITEAARGEGGRLFVYRNNEKWYFMEEKYPEYKNLMPRDVVSREMATVVKMADCGGKVYLDMTDIPKETWEKKLPDFRTECIRFLSVDPKQDYIEVAPGIHYFMGGIHVDINHRTNIEGLFAAGECACQYHGANRLGGNSMLGAIYGGKVAACSAIEQTAVRVKEYEHEEKTFIDDSERKEEISDILKKSLGVFRTKEELEKGLKLLGDMNKTELSEIDEKRLMLAKAMVLSALNRKESRGAHTRVDYPEKDDVHFRMTTVAVCDGENITLHMEKIAERED